MKYDQKRSEVRRSLRNFEDALRYLATAPNPNTRKKGRAMLAKARKALVKLAMS